MKKVFCYLLFFTLAAYAKKKTNTYEILLQPANGTSKQYAAEDKYQLFIKTPTKEVEVYSKLLYEYTVQYVVQDSLTTGRIRFDNFRIEFEDGQGIQVFDTKFDKPDKQNIELRFYFAMLKKQIEFTAATDGTIRAVKGIPQLKNEIIDHYAAAGFTGAKLDTIISKILDQFVVNHMLQENYLFYTRKPVIKDSSYAIQFNAKTPLPYQLNLQYNIRSQTENETVLTGKGKAILSDQSKKEYPFSLLKTNTLQAEAMDEIKIDQQSGLLQYRKFYFSITDSMQIDAKKIPLRVIVENEIREKKPE